MAIVEGWMPPSRENWELLLWLWQFFPLVTLPQWTTDWYPQGKTSVLSRLNVPGKIGWATMEAPGFINLLYIMTHLPQQNGITELPTANWLMAGLFTVHYLYRALLSPLLLNPSMSPIHVSIWVSALGFQLVNSTCIGGWLAGYGPVTAADWEGRTLSVQIGVVVFAAGLIGNFIHDEELRNIRRNALKKKDAASRKAGTDGAAKVYEIPSHGLFDYILYPHYFCEWIEWAGYWIIGGWACVPARCFLLNEMTTMFPRALAGRRWYVEKFGKEKIAGRKAIIPGII